MKTITIDSVEYNLVPVEPEAPAFSYPMWFKSSRDSSVVKFTTISTGTVW